MKKTVKILAAVAVCIILISPAVSLAQAVPQQDTGLVPCDNSAGDPCNFNALMELINTVINFVLFKMALPIAAIMFAYAGFKMIIPGGEAAHARTQAKGIFMNTLIGFIIAVAAWLIISTVLAVFGYDGAWIGLKIGL